MTAPITPTPHQQAALDQIQAALSPRRPTLLCGYAGTGKTTLAHWLAGELNHPLFLAPTNRAAWVLRSKLPPARECKLFTPRPCSRWDPRTGTIYSF